MIDFCGIELAHPIINASGTFDAVAARRAFGDALIEHFPFAAFVSKTVTVAPRQGNPPPRLWEVASGLINSIGLPNKGLDGYLAEDLPKLAALPVPLIVNVMGSTRDQVAELVKTRTDELQHRASFGVTTVPGRRGGTVPGVSPVGEQRLTLA